MDTMTLKYSAVHPKSLVSFLKSVGEMANSTAPGLLEALTPERKTLSRARLPTTIIDGIIFHRLLPPVARGRKQR